MRRYRSAVVLACGVACAGLVACQLLVGVKNEEGVPRPVESDAGQDADPCTKNHPPEPPSDADLPVATAGSAIVFGIRQFEINPVDRVLGYDLDNRCTGDPTSTTAEGACVSRAGADLTDKPNGVDNEFQRDVLPAFVAAKDGSPADPAASTLNSDIEEGRRTVFIGLSDYNGEANDAEIKVGLAASERMEAADCNGCTLTPPDAGTFDDAGAPPRPRWDGLDVWYYTPNSSVVNGVISALLHGYVRGGVLVTLPADISISIRGAVVTFRDAVLTATIVRADGGGPYSLEHGIVAGRIPAAEVVVSATTLINASKACSDPHYVAVKNEVCRDRDLPNRQTDDGKGLPCDSISIAIGFSAYPVRLGYEGPGAPPLPCDASSFACE